MASNLDTPSIHAVSATTAVTRLMSISTDFLYMFGFYLLDFFFVLAIMPVL